MIIRQQQIAVFDVIGEKKFEDEMVEHIQQFAPRLSDVVSEPGVRRAVQLGLKRSRQYGLSNRGPVRFYIEAMISFGSDFDTDPQLPWAAEILTSKAPVDQATRADLLFQKTHEYYQLVMGPDNSYGIEAMRRIANAQWKDLIASDGEFSDRILSGLQRMYPQKYWYVGEPLLRALAGRGIEMAQAYSIASGPGAALLIGLMFGFGHGVATDPLYPWVGRTLKDTLIQHPQDRVLRLSDKLMVYARRVLEYVDEG